MKELSIEEKAKRYDEAYKRVAIRFGSNVANEIFLKESEDERIRKAILWCIRTVELELGCKDVEGIDVAELKSWLEKQGEHYNFRQKIQIRDQVTRNEDGVLVNLSQLNRVAKKGELQRG